MRQRRGPRGEARRTRRCLVALLAQDQSPGRVLGARMAPWEACGRSVSRRGKVLLSMFKCKSMYVGCSRMCNGQRDQPRGTSVCVCAQVIFIYIDAAHAASRASRATGTSCKKSAQPSDSHHKRRRRVPPACAFVERAQVCKHIAETLQTQRMYVTGDRYRAHGWHARTQ